MSYLIEKLKSLPPIEPTLTATDIKKKLYKCVKMLDNKKSCHPNLVGFLVGQYKAYRDLYTELTALNPSDNEIRKWKYEF